MRRKKKRPAAGATASAGAGIQQQQFKSSPHSRQERVREALRRLTMPGQVVELRALDVPALNPHARPHTVAGWFDDPQKLVRAALQLESRQARGIYITLNPCNPALLARAHNRVEEYPKHTTADADIVRRIWLPFDFDPVRPSGISATPGELRQAKVRALKAERWLSRMLGERPAIWAFSGNGFHLLYRIDLPNTDRSTQYVRWIIDNAASEFSDEVVKLDRTVFNAARIWKLYGMMTRKGDELPEQGRVYRRSAIRGEGFAK